MNPHGVGGSDVGLKRSKNEDSFVVDDGLGLYVISDGMGGHAAGEVASAEAVATVKSFFEGHRAELGVARSGDASDEEMSALVSGAIKQACAAVYEHATSNNKLAGMGATMTMLLVAGDKVVMGHVGDSRLFLIREGSVEQLSDDHRMGDELIRRGLVTPEEAQRMPHGRTLTRSIGNHASVQVDTLVLEALPTDRFLICTDGLHDYFEKPAAVLEHLKGDFDTTPQRLIAHANASGGEDNITCVVLQMDKHTFSPERTAELTMQSQTKMLALRASYLFRDLEFKHLIKVLEIGREQRLTDGEILVEAGQPIPALCVVLHGQLVLDSPGNQNNGRPAPFWALGGIVGEKWMYRDSPAPATVRAKGTTLVLVLEKKIFQAMTRKHPEFGLTLTERILSR